MSALKKNQHLLCPACDAERPVDFFSSRSPVNIGRLCDSPEEARAARMGQIDLCYCCQCEFVWNRSYDASLLTFGPGYEFSLVHSPLFLSFIESVAKRLIDTYNIRNQSVVEVGCGRGEFLTLLCELGGNQGYGFDPSLQDEREFDVGSGHVNLIRDYYGHKYAGVPADFLCSLSVLEDIDRPAEFLTEIRSTIGTRHTKAYFEVFNGARALATLSGWSISFEQCNYWAPNSLRTAINRSGFSILGEGSCYGDDEYLYVDAVASTVPQMRNRDGDSRLPDELCGFSAEYNAICDEWRDKLCELKNSGKNIAVWGTGGKGINFLNAMTNTRIDRVVDINPQRQGKFIPGSGHLVMAPESLINCEPDVIIITNPLYADEIKTQVSGLGLTCQFLLA